MRHIYERDVPMDMRDGVTLRANVWRPLEGTAPTLVMRTSYNKEMDRFAGGPFNPVPSLTAFLNAGYAVVIQDGRGTYASDGTFEPKVNEVADGEDTLAWLREQEWFDGTVGAYGASYMGMTQWAMAVSGERSLKAFAPSVAAVDWYSGLWYSPGGALSLSMLTFWTTFMYAAEEQRAFEHGETDSAEAAQRLFGALADPLALCDALPVADLPVIGKGRWCDDWLAHPDFDDYWKAQDWRPSIGAVTAPALFTSGWYDLFVHETVADFMRMRSEAASEKAREGSRLVIGPWHHEMPMNGEFRDRSFGAAADCDLSPSHVAFFDEWLRGRPAPSPQPRVRIFVMGIDQWRDEEDWPLPDTRYVDYHLSSSGSANTAAGDGVLSLEAPTAAAQDTFRYDPRDPVPTAGGAVLPFPGFVGPVDQRAVDGRSDVLCYLSPTLETPLEVTGFVNLTVFVSSSAVDTDITAKLVDVFPDGRALNLCDGILRLRYRNDLSKPELMTPGEVYEVTVPMAVTSNVFLTGHRIRLDISSSNFPHYDRNSNTGGVIATEAVEDMVVADNTVHHGGARPSRLILPVIDR
ncbi:CocE/NonD family hydrolase [Parafrankia sp. EUN1f]|uniref:CocE/NonD family hydrolase n=1 Tax=Parafrankia sp. EUN1f TaxID=102897 RepID=UPI0001C43DFB|nr:CocE/NonD family hydrolase [Parafrankia sp. EUN1f]EFC85769.1 X-Pro dipeptidyl-peptidase domain protein [Parafrankia sp. EUN1f]